MAISSQIVASAKQYESELAKLRLHVQPVSVRKEAPLKGIFMSNPVRLNLTGVQLELICV